MCPCHGTATDTIQLLHHYTVIFAESRHPSVQVSITILLAAIIGDYSHSLRFWEHIKILSKYLQKEMLVHLKVFAEVSTTIYDCILLFATQFIGVMHIEGNPE